jgi:mRNA-degrading endonuclease RelE of RelBE toxin-antitoxin system
LAWTVEFTPGAERDLKQLDKPIQKRISKFLGERIVDDPRAIRGRSYCRDRGRDWSSFVDLSPLNVLGTEFEA